MKLYFAGAGIPRKDAMEFRHRKLEAGEIYRFLYSYLEIKNRNYSVIQEGIIQPDQIFLDSGAFTAFTQGVIIDIDDYIKVIQETGLKYYAVLDVIGDWKKTAENLAYMESKGLNPIPAFHYNSPLEELEKLVQKYEYIALGGLVPLAMQRPVFQNWVDQCFSIIRNRTKVHGFGVNSLWAWKRYPWYSADATSWVTGSKFRRIVKFNQGKMITYKKDLTQTYGTMQTYAGHYVDLNCQNMEEYQKAAKFVTDLWKIRGIDWKD